MKKNNTNRSCIVCGEEYAYCSTGCGKSIDKPAWMGIFHSEKCRDLYYICSNYKVGQTLTKDEAKEKLSKFDLSNINDSRFNPKFKEWIMEITDNLSFNTTQMVEKAEEQIAELVYDEEFEKELNSDEPVG